MACGFSHAMKRGAAAYDHPRARAHRVSPRHRDRARHAPRGRRRNGEGGAMVRRVGYCLACGMLRELDGGCAGAVQVRRAAPAQAGEEGLAAPPARGQGARVVGHEIALRERPRPPQGPRVAQGAGRAVLAVRRRDRLLAARRAPMSFEVDEIVPVSRAARPSTRATSRPPTGSATSGAGTGRRRSPPTRSAPAARRRRTARAGRCPSPARRRVRSGPPSPARTVRGPSTSAA